jgi:hypothetical protein
MSANLSGSNITSGPYGSDRRSLRRADGTTSASSHPELVNGDLAIPPRPCVPITSIGRSSAPSGSRRTFGLLAAVAVAAVLSTVVFRDGTSSDAGDAETQKLARTCLQWHLAAGAAVSRLVQSTRDADLVQVNDAVFRMRRARRNCEAGWVTLACQDYHAVATVTPGHAMTSQMFPCSRVATFSYERD